MKQTRWYEGRTALITGATSALGRAFAEALARRGTHLILLDSEPERLPVWAAWLSRVNAVQVEVMRTDLHQVGVAQLIDAAVEEAKQWVDLFITDTCCGMPGRWMACWRPRSASQPVPLVVSRSSNLPPKQMVAQTLRALDRSRSGTTPGRFYALFVRSIQAGSSAP